MKNTIYLLVFIVLGIIPLSSFSAIEVIGNTIHKHTGLQGDTYTGAIVIRNLADTDQEVRIYQTDYLYNWEGQSFYDEPVSHSRSNAGWIELSPKFIILKAKETQNIQYEVKIPENDSLTGTYWSLLMVEGVNPIDPDRKGQLNISTSTRFAIQVVTNIGNTGIGELRFMQPTLTTEGDNLFFDVVMENVGERLISPIVTAEFFDETGKSVKVFEVSKKGMYPTTSVTFRFKIEGIEAEKTYYVILVADGGDDDVFGLETTLNL